MPKKENSRNTVKKIDVEKEYHVCTDMTKDYMPHNLYEDTYSMEVTVTFDKRRFNNATAYLAKTNIVQNLLSWHPIANLVCATEYTDKGDVHYHLSLGSEIPFPEGWAHGTMRAFERFYGFTTVKGVAFRDKYGDYLVKEVERNNLKGHPHYELYTRKDIEDFDHLIKV